MKIISLMSTFILTGLLTTVSLAQGDIDLDLGDIPSGQQVTITYDVTVNDDLPSGLLFITNQGIVSGQGFDPILSNDPDTVEGDDATNTQVGFTLQVTQLPQTGESPIYRWVLISAVIAMLATIGGLVTIKRIGFITQS